MSAQEPVWLPEGAEPLNGRISQTFARHFDTCRRSAYLYALRQSPSSVEMDRGTAFHAAIERCVREIVEQGDVRVPPEVAKAILDEVLAEHDVPLHEQDYLRECVFRWAREWVVDPQRLVACEQLLVLDVGGLAVRCKVDYAELSPDGSRLVISDWKSSRAMPAQEEVSRKRPDGSFSAKSFQLVLYALALVFGVPARRAPDGEVREPFQLAPRAQMVEASFVYPGIEDRDGRMARRACDLNPLELHEYLQSLEALCRRVKDATETGDWRARPGSWCGECPAPMMCPIAPSLRTYRDKDGGVAAAGNVTTTEEASERAELVDRAKAVVAAWEKELKAWSKGHDGMPIAFGDMEFAWSPTSSEEIPDRNALWLAVEESRLYGAEFDRGRYVRQRSGTRWTRRKRLPVEQEGSNGRGEQEAA